MRSKLRGMMKQSRFNTLEKLASELGVAPQTVHRWCRLGERDKAGNEVGALPIPRMIDELCRVFECRIGDLFEEDVSRNPDRVTLSLAHLEESARICGVTEVLYEIADQDHAASIKRLTFLGNKGPLEIELLSVPEVRFGGFGGEYRWDPARLRVEYGEAVNLVLTGYPGGRSLGVGERASAAASMPFVEVHAMRRIEGLSREYDHLATRLTPGSDYLSGVLHRDQRYLEYGEVIQLADEHGLSYGVIPGRRPGKVIRPRYEREYDLT